MNKTANTYRVYISILLLTIVSVVTGMLIGPFDFSGEEWLAILSGDDSQAGYTVIWNLRLPRLLVAWAVGGLLAYCGYIMQHIFQNPLADPYLLGTSSGASLGTTIVFAGGFFTVSNFYVPALMAFLGAIGATVLVLLLAKGKEKHYYVGRLLLAGVAVSALATALQSIFIFMGNNENKFRSVVIWSMGNLEKADWQGVVILYFAVILSIILAWSIASRLSIAMLGEERAKSLGLDLSKLRIILLVYCAFIVGLVVSVVGPLGFVGLIVPHVVRNFRGTVAQDNLFACILLGGCFLVMADIVSRLLVSPGGLPIGVVTAFLGIPFFVYLLFKNQY